jgi:Ca2+-binding EF-hand superfamily protein
MFDRDASGTIEFREFRQLWRYLKQWNAYYNASDKNGDGSVDKKELAAALSSAGE